MLLYERRWELLVLASLWGTLFLIRRTSKRPGRGWCPECTAPDLWIVSRETPTTRALGMAAFAFPGLYTLARLWRDASADGYGSLLVVIALAGLGALVARSLRPEQRRCESCGFQAGLPKASP